jgi:hypothetical protein
MFSWWRFIAAGSFCLVVVGYAEAAPLLRVLPKVIETERPLQKVLPDLPKFRSKELPEPKKEEGERFISTTSPTMSSVTRTRRRPNVRLVVAIEQTHARSSSSLR